MTMVRERLVLDLPPTTPLRCPTINYYNQCVCQATNRALVPQLRSLFTYDVFIVAAPSRQRESRKRNKKLFTHENQGRGEIFPSPPLLARQCCALAASSLIAHFLYPVLVSFVLRQACRGGSTRQATQGAWP